MSMTKAEFQTAFRGLISEEFCDIPADGSSSHVFSDHFEKRMDRLIRSTERIYWSWINTAAKRAAVIAVAIFTLLSTAMSVKAIREPVIKFFTEIYEKYIDISFEGETSKAIEYEYTLTFVPEGYSISDVQRDVTLVTTTFENTEGNILILDQSITASIDLSLDNERGTITNTSVGEIPVLVYETRGLIHVSWAYDSYHFMLTHYGETNKETMLEIVQGIK